MNPFIAKYLRAQCKDIILFCELAVGLGYIPDTLPKLRRLLAKAIEWMIQHGTPTEDDVRVALGLGDKPF